VVADPKYCANEKFLFGVDDSIKKLELNMQQDRDSLLNDIEKLLGTVPCEKETIFGMDIGHSRILKLGVFKSCGTIHCGLDPYLSIELCSQNKILVNMFLSEVDSIPFLAARYIENSAIGSTISSRLYDGSVLLNWHKDTDEKRIKKVMESIIDGYMIVYKKLALENFKKPLYKLNANELNDLKSILDFDIQIGCNWSSPNQKTIDCFEFTRLLDGKI